MTKNKSTLLKKPKNSRKGIKKVKDYNYKPGYGFKSHKPKDHINLVKMRLPETKGKIAALINTQLLSLQESKLMETHQSIETYLASNLKIKEKFRPICEITQFSSTNTPLVGKSPGGTNYKLERDPQLNPLVWMYSQSNSSPYQSPTKLTIDPDLVEEEVKASPAYEAIIAAQQNFKTITTKLCPKYKAPTNRSKPQIDVMATNSKSKKLASAAQYNQPVKKLFSGEIKYEWLHLIAYFILGDAAQISANLVSGTDGANMAMLISAEALVQLLKQKNLSADITVSATTLGITHIGNKISYRIKNDKIDLSFKFDAQSPRQPMLEASFVYRAIFDALLLTKTKNSNIKTKRKLFTDDKLPPMVLFHKKKCVYDKENQPPINIQTKKN